MWQSVKSAVPAGYYNMPIQVYDPWQQVLKKVPDPGLLDESSLKGSGSYSNAALKGGRSYTNAALKGGRSYTNAALKGGKRTRRLRGGEMSDEALDIFGDFVNSLLEPSSSSSSSSKTQNDPSSDFAQLAGELGPTFMNSISQIALDQGKKVEDLVKDPEKLMSLAVKYGPTAKKAVTALYSSLSNWWNSGKAADDEYEYHEPEPKSRRQELIRYLDYLKDHNRVRYRTLMNKIRRLRSRK